ncbi:dihydroxyacetone kinase phosphoryl donor subunit DhaM [Aestuariimicrobium sp. p3-SID1156]|nr:dihydroxyacetone kinase phosphoryl donor subunit DhaM [Aestuariimicrobium sp. p3-SID1156]
MIGIVVVSHSRPLAEAAVALAREMTPESPPIAVAAGVEDGTAFGTDAMAISEAITEVDSAEGVLVLLDLGSAILSAEMALEFLDPEVAERVLLSPAPLVEGVVAAVVTAASGAPLAAVAREAAAGAEAKQAQLAPSPSAAAPAADHESRDEMVTGDGAPDGAPPGGIPRDGALVWETTLTGAHGLHARPAAAFVSALRGLDAEVQVSNQSTGAGPVNGSSLSKLATLGLRRGQVLRALISGSDAEMARQALQRLADENFGEVETAVTGPAPVVADATGGPGLMSPLPRTGTQVVVGTVHITGLDVDVSGYVPADDEAARLDDVTNAVMMQLFMSTDDVVRMQATMLSDPELGGQLNAALDGGASAVEAVDTVFTRVADELAALPDSYQAERAQDLRSLRRQLLAGLVGQPEARAPESEHILVAPELDAVTAAALDPATCVAVVTTTGGSTGHGVIIATGRGIPVLTGREEAAEWSEGETVALDPVSGELWASPDEQTLTMITERARERATADREAAERAHERVHTANGQLIMVEANVGSLEDAERGAAGGADGSGLVRTELLFGDWSHAPSAAEQAEVLGRVAAAFGGGPITIRTWDVGGDKPLPYLPQEQELNPFLGERGLRTMRRVPEFFREQLRGIAMVARQYPVRVMFPMVTEPEEMGWARSVALEIIDEVGCEPFPIGMMVEVPAAALRAGDFEGLTDFVSIGTNDLTQYTTASDRTNGAVSHLARSDSEAVLALMRMTCEQLPGVPVAVCGDLASRTDMTATLVEMGVTELSVRPPLVGLVKQAVRQS